MLLLAGLQNAHFARCGNDKATRPLRDLLFSKQFLDSPDQVSSFGGTQAHEENAVMRPRSESAKIREIHILSNQKSRIPLYRFPDLRILMAEERLRVQSVDIVAHGLQNPRETQGQIFVELDLHRMRGTAGAGRSSSAEAAAKAMAA